MYKINTPILDAVVNKVLAVNDYDSLLDLAPDDNSYAPIGNYSNWLRNPEADELIRRFLNKRGIKEERDSIWTMVQFNTGIASYSSDTNVIHKPRDDQFVSAEQFYRVMFHELSHATQKERGHVWKTNDDFSYVDRSIEETTAEMSSLLVLNALGINRDIDAVATYAASWSLTPKDATFDMIRNIAETYGATTDEVISRETKPILEGAVQEAIKAAEIILNS